MTQPTAEQKEIGTRIRDARNARGWTQVEFARRAAVSPGTISNWERGFVPPIRELTRVATQVLRVDPRLLVADAEISRSDALEIVRKLDEALWRLSRLEEAVARSVVRADRSDARGRRA